MRRLALVLAVLLLAAPAAAQTTYYVTKTGNNSNTCVQAQTLATAKLTIAAALTCVTTTTGAGADVTVQVGTGVYAETITAWPSGTSGHPFLLKSATALGAVIRPAAFTGQILRFNANYITVDGLSIDGVNTSGNNVWFSTGVTGVTLTNGEIHNVKIGDGTGPGSFEAIYCEGGNSHTVSNMHIYDVAVGYSIHASHGIYWACSNSTISGNTIHNVSGFGMQIYSESVSNLSNNVIRNNRIYDFGAGGSSAGIYISGGLGGGGSNNLAVNNLVYQPTFNSLAYGIMVYGPGQLVYNNTIYNLAVGIEMSGTSTSTIRNNIVNGGGLSAPGANTLSNNITVAPIGGFVNVASGDFHVTASATNVVNQGATIATASPDFEGVTRPKGAAYDIGAYELTPPATPIIATARQGLWSTAGATITVRTTQCGATLNPGVTAAQINTAIQNCTAGQFVLLGPGVFNLNGSIDFAGKSNVTLRGNGPNSTIVNFTGNSFVCGGLFPDVCVGPASNYDDIDSTQNTATWSASYAKGATSVTLSTTANLAVGSLLFLDQLDDSNTDNLSLWNCSALGACANEGGRSGRNSPGTRNQTEVQIVTSVPGGGAAGSVGISPGLEMPNWRSGQTPQAYWRSTQPITGVGIEGISFDSTNNGMDPYVSRGTLLFRSATHSWLSNVIATRGKRAMTLFYMSSNLTLKDSYLHTSRSLADQAYGVELFITGHSLIQNNIVLDTVASMIPQGAGNVFAYNYIDFNTYNPSGAPFPPGNSQIQAGLYHHDGGTAYTLYEGNDANSMKADMVHGTANFITGFRNRLWGQEPLKTCHTTGVLVYAFNRFGNTIGNVIGTQGYHTSYNADQTGCGGKAIYLLGPNTLGALDTRVESTMMRWGNYDTVNAANRFVSAEVPSGLSDYPNPVPADQTLPSSLYRGATATAPTWWTTPWGSPAYPPIGPDVTGGTLAGVAGHAQKIPARLCYENSAKTTSGSTTGTIQLISGFNATACYSTTSVPSDTVAPVVTITTNAGANFSTIDPLLTTLAGGATDDVLVVFDCRWTNAANAGAGTAPGAFSWSVPSIPLALGPNLITVFCHDAANNEGSDTITVTLDQPPPSGPFYRLRIGG